MIFSFWRIAHGALDSSNLSQNVFRTSILILNMDIGLTNLLRIKKAPGSRVLVFASLSKSVSSRNLKPSLGRGNAGSVISSKPVVPLNRINRGESVSLRL